MLYVATVFLAFFTSLEQPSRQSMIPSLVPRAQLVQALALQGGTQRYVPIIAGPSWLAWSWLSWGPAACYGRRLLVLLAMLAALRLLRTKIPEGGGWKTISVDSPGRRDCNSVASHGVIFPLVILTQRDVCWQRRAAYSRSTRATFCSSGPGLGLYTPRAPSAHCWLPAPWRCSAQ